MLPFMSSDQTNGDFFIDANGCLCEGVFMGDQEVILHYDGIPETDITLVKGLRCTTPLRTVIDLATGVDAVELEQMVRQCIDQGLFTAEEALQRVTMPDMLARQGAELVRQIVSSLGEAA